MRTFLSLLAVGTLLGAGAAAAAQSPPIQKPAFTISVTVTPTSVARGETVTADVTITNITATDGVAQVTWTLLPPTRNARSGSLGGHFSVVVPGRQTVERSVTFTVPKSAVPGTYDLAVFIAAGGIAPAHVNIDVT